MGNLPFDWHLASWVCLQLFSLIFTPGPFLRQAIIDSTPSPPSAPPCELEVPVNASGQVVVAKNVRKVAARLMTTAAPGANGALGKVS